MRLSAIVVLAATLSGCITQSPNVESTKPWEGHYFTVEEFKEKTSSIELDEGESIWVIDNHTMHRLLKNTRK